MTPALTYLKINEAVADLVSVHSGNDVSRAAYMVARAALLNIRAMRGEKEAARLAADLAREMGAAG